MKKTLFKPAAIIIILNMFSNVLTGQIQVVVTPAGCGQSNGSAMVTGVTHGTPPFIYTWSTGQQGASISNIPAGYYTVTVQDANSCSGVKEIEVSDEGGLDISFTSTGNIPDCGNLVSPYVHVTAHATGGTPPYTFIPAQTISVNESGKYYFDVRDANSCSGRGVFLYSYIKVRCSRDPNEIKGPMGYGDKHFINQTNSLTYYIYFENDPVFATAAAQRIIISCPVDQLFSRSTLQLGEFSFDNMVFQIPPNSSTYTTRLDLRGSMGIFADVTSGYNIMTNSVFWIVQAIDPSTGLPPASALLGLLPVNDSTGKGEGHVTFSIKPKGTTITGDTLVAKASIVFDVNPPIETNVWKNTIDKNPPSSHVNPLPAYSDSSGISVTFAGTDDTGGSGIKKYALYYAEEGGPFQVYGECLKDSCLVFFGNTCRKYRFFSRATDQVGNTENMKNSEETSIFIQPSPVFLFESEDTLVAEGASFPLKVFTQNPVKYNWEVSYDGGNNFILATEGSFLSDVNTNIIQLSNIDKEFNGIKFRCQASNGICFSHSRIITVHIGSRLSGKIYYKNLVQSPINNAEVHVRSTGETQTRSVNTNPGGIYTFTQALQGQVITSVSVNKPWGGVNATDALLILRHYAHMDTLEPVNVKAANVNASYGVNAADALFAARRFIGLVDSFPSGDWYCPIDTVILSGNSTIHNIPVLCYGDVDGSYTPEQKKVNLAFSNSGRIKVSPNSLIDIPVFINRSVTAGAVSLEILYPSDLLTVKNIKPGNSIENSSFLYSIEKNKIRIAWYSLEGIPLVKETPFLVITVFSSEKTLLGDFSFTLEGLTEITGTTGKPIDGLQLITPLLYSEQTNEAFSLAQNYPNPFVENTEISYFLSKACHVTLILYNPLGQILQSLVNTDQGKGCYRIQLSGSGLSFGSYIYELTVTDKGVFYKQNRTLTKIR
ncbi:MAG: hypothetical protein NTU44_08310 [Bacteroidetes bacterium]|nr:hypothetical protein [Bacteroidota bacterium]